MKLKAQNAVVSIEDLDILLDLSTDDALSIALDHASNQELEPEWYDELASKLGDTQQAAFTSGLVDKGIRVMSKKQANSTLTKLKNHFIALANEQGCLYEDDYHAACHDITDSRLIGDINTWILSAGLQLKKNKPKAESDYKKKVRDVAKHPNINKLTNKSAKKEEIEKPEVKKSFPDKMPESDLVQKKTDYPPLYGLNKVIKELKDKEFKTEFLPPWKKKEAQADDDWATDEAERWLLNDEGLYNEAIDIGTTVGNNYPDIANALEELVSNAGIMEASDLGDVDWNTLAANVLEWEEVDVEEEVKEDEEELTPEEAKRVFNMFLEGYRKAVETDPKYAKALLDNAKWYAQKYNLEMPVEGIEEEGAVGQEINMYDDGHFPIGGNKEAQQRGKCIHCGEIFVPYDPGSGQLITDECPICKDLMKQKEVEDLEEEACLDPGRKERSKGKGRGLGKGKGKGPLGVPIKDKILSKKAQQEALFGDSDIEGLFEESDFTQAQVPPKYITEGDLNKFGRFQELQTKQAQGMLTPDEEIELSALAEELGPMMPGLAKKVAQMSSGQGLEAEKTKLESQINSQFASSTESQQWLQAVYDAPDWPTLEQIWRQLFGGYVDQPQQLEQRWPDAAPEDYGMVELQNKRNKDPVEANIQKSARKEFQSATAKKRVTFENCSFTAHVANTEIQKAAGLEAFNDLQPNEGMVFPFDKPSHVTFHMGSVKFPIDIIFLMEEPTALKIAKIIHNAQPGAFEHWSCPNTSYVLEVVGGTAKKNGLGIGSECVIKDRISPKG